MKSNVHELNQLTNIKGIGDTKAQWLQEAKIQTVSDLLTIPAEEIEKRLKANDHRTSHIEIEDWIMQAKEFHMIDSSIYPKLKYDQFESETFATFIVEFQKSTPEQGNQIHTLVQHMEGGKLGEGENYRWPNLPDARLTDWMKDQINDQYLVAKEKEFPQKLMSSKKSTHAPKQIKQQSIYEPIIVTISNLRAHQPPETPIVVGEAKSGEIFTGYIKGNQPFVLVLDFYFSSQKTTEAAKESFNYQIQTYITNRKSGELIQLEQIHDNINTGKEVRKSTCLPITTLNSGYYRLETVVTVSSSPPTLSFLEVPLLQVV